MTAQDQGRNSVIESRHVNQVDHKRQELGGDQPNVASTPDEGVTQRHNTGSVMGMFGGQTEFMKFRAYALEAGIGGYRGLRPGRFWCNPGSVTGE